MTEEMVANANKEVHVTGTAATTENAEHADANANASLPDSGTGAQLSDGQIAFLTALVANPDIALAAEAAGVCRATAYRWMKEPACREELTRQRNEIFAETLATVKAHAAQAVTQLAGLMTTTDERVRHLACKDMLDRAIKVHDMLDLERRLAALEKAVKNQQRPGR